jgi:2-keto-3-deoxy-L-rhamnonate aldolase RhmA
MGIPCFARVPDAEYHLIARTLDAGASGIMVPRVETLNKVEEVIRAAKYPPVGERGFGARTIITDYQNTPVRDLAAQQNQDTLVILQIERRRAIENIDSLLSVAGIDVALIGPNDLSISLGVPGDEDNPIMVEAIQKVVEACERHGIVSGIHLGDMKRLLFWKERGMRFLMYSTDAKFLLSAASASVKDIRETM